jgi:hypothetical protein
LVYAVIIAHRQTQINDRQLRIARFDLRYAVYQAVMNLISRALCGDLEMRHVFEYRAATDWAQFLFEKSIADYVEKLQDKAIEFQLVLVEQRTDLQATGVLNQDIERRRQELFEFFNRQYSQATKRFSPHLSVE